MGYPYNITKFNSRNLSKSLNTRRYYMVYFREKNQTKQFSNFHATLTTAKSLNMRRYKIVYL